MVPGECIEGANNFTTITSTRRTKHDTWIAMTGPPTNGYYRPVSLDILSGFDDDDDDGDGIDPRVQAELSKRPSSTVAVVNGGRDTPPPPGRLFGGYKPMSQQLMQSIFAGDTHNVFTANETRLANIGREAADSQVPHSYGAPPLPQLQQKKGYQPTSASLLAGFSDDEDDIYEVSDDEKQRRVARKGGPRNPNGGARVSNIVTGDDRNRTTKNRGAKVKEVTLIDLTDSSSGWSDVDNADEPISARQSNVSVAFQRNQRNLAPADLPGYFAPEDLR